MNPYKVFHSIDPLLRKKLHIIMVRPTYGGNVGSAARAIANMGIEGSFRIVGSPKVVDSDCLRMAKHATNRIQAIQHFSTLREALPNGLSLASTARVGSPGRPHPRWVRHAVPDALEKLLRKEVENVTFVFGPEADGLTNDEIELCDWVVTIPSSEQYRSLNLSQAILIFSYEANMALLKDWESFEVDKPTQKDRLITHVMRLAEDVGFILPGDPFKMRPRLEEIFGRLPRHIQGVRTLHGLLDQISRTVKKGAPDFKGRYRHRLSSMKSNETEEATLSGKES